MGDWGQALADFIRGLYWFIGTLVGLVIVLLAVIGVLIFK